MPPIPVAVSPSDPAVGLRAVAPNDGADMNPPARALWVGGAGALSVIAWEDEDAAPVTISGVAAGTLLPIAVRRVRATGTTATLIVALL
ncbi:MAG: hypothetical protein LC798_21505 [Chloroflexi bacterium]|nr:hypothetical protein [Chloroflexota bacterium]